MQGLFICLLCVSLSPRTQTAPEKRPAGIEEKQAERLLQNPRGG